MKRFLKKTWAWFLFAFAVVAGVFFMLLKPSPSREESPVKAARRLKERRIAEADAEAAVEIARAQGREEEVKRQVESIKETSDEYEQAKQLAELLNRTRRR